MNVTRRDQSRLYRSPTLRDVLNIPLLGPVLKWRYGRLVLQAVLFVAAVLITYDGFTGPQSAARNLATLAPWVQYRGLVVMVILLTGNLFCMGCPFTITRTLGKRLASSGRRFPRVLRNKWLAIFSLLLIFFLYEWLDLWASPLLTAWMIVAYFVASFALEAIFSESAFCKYVCPLGSFNFVYSTASPTQIGVKDADVCRHCQGHECINGSYASSPVIRIDEIPSLDASGLPASRKVVVKRNRQGVLGCGTELFPPQITSNLDCVYCLDCVRACPHDNIGLMLRKPGRELLLPGSWPQRWDITLLPIALAFMAIVNAFGMVPPVYRLLGWFAALGFKTEFFPLLLIVVVGGFLLPVMAAMGAGWLGRVLTNTTRRYTLRATVAAFAPSFVPLAFGIWIAHYGFHFLIAPLSIIPVIQEFLGYSGDWARFSAPVNTAWINGFQAIALLGGFFWSMWIAQKIAFRQYGRQSVAGMLPWSLLLLFLALAAYRIFSMPMEMRGTEDIFALLNMLIHV